MVHCFLFAPFADAARQRQYEVVCEVLEEEVAAPTTLVLGNLAAFGIELDAVVVRPRSVVALLLEPRSGHLSVPALEYGAWRLNGRPLPGRAAADNPFDHYQQQAPALMAWLSEEVGRTVAELPPATGMVLFEAPLTFGPEVERQLRHYPAASDFQLLSDPQLLPRRLWQLAQPEALLAEHELQEWANHLAATHQQTDDTADFTPAPTEAPDGFWSRKLRQLWGWLGAEDIPADPPYGAPAASTTSTQLAPAEQHQEQLRLEQLRQELQQQLTQQQQASAARESAQAQELVQLRQQAAHADQLETARRAEQQEQALEEALRTLRAEAATRNQELDTRIQQLGQLLAQLNRPAAPPAADAGQLAPATESHPVAPRALPSRPAKSLQLVRAERAALLVLVLLIGLVAGVWGVRYLVRPESRPHTTTRSGRPQNATPSNEPLAADSSFSEEAPPDSLPDLADPPILDEEALQPSDPAEVMRVPTDSAARAVENERPTPETPNSPSP